eukprot:CAMPEP_0170508060 /NCGR_PEP_ID=MMETSP0208-20121228/61089_1 /TAXON_ID=197538 /ORGANISM="Strombidium inclinatum, Strain S3" /LENGTH=109 /DNA_ID=CAMNT_0010790711 /DNA_START=480 /DNA_END=809 /DNA_ORIENTATION=+
MSLTSLNFVTVSSFLTLLGTTVVLDPAFTLDCKLFSMGSSALSSAGSSLLPVSLALFRLASSDTLICSPLTLRVKKNLPCFEFLLGTTVEIAPLFFLVSSDTAIGSLFL